ncbi:phage portal protein [Rothia sp. ZJ1223]|uniref:phage portal protein n=1 Tax=Rothia sp. ZJ1223 TaxID=2811098 RepID=UPI001959096B|nr:phage portal protein [Rothia sp. ZJ1223]MBM7052223.1 phage portal protein [Rothia sp. ZJ1223]
MGIFGIFSRNSRLLDAAINAPLPADTFALASPWADNSHLKEVTYAHLHDLPTENAPITRTDAMSLAAVAKARNIIAGTIGRFPMVAMSGREPYAQNPAWTQQIEHNRPRSLTITWTVDHLLFYGRAFWVITDRYATGYPRQFAWVPEAEAEVSDTGALTAAWGQKVPPDAYIRFDAPNEGLLTFGRRVLRKALDTERAAENAAANPVPSIELHQTNGDDLSDEEIQNLLDGWRAARTSRGGGVGYTNPLIDVRTHGQAAEQLLIDAQNQAALGIARAMGLPAWAVDASVQGASMNYSNSASRGRELIDFGLMPYMAAIADRLSMDDVAPRGVWVKFETTDYLDPPLKEKVDALKVAIDAGIYTAEEARRIMQGIPLESTVKDGNQNQSDPATDSGRGTEQTQD